MGEGRPKYCWKEWREEARAGVRHARLMQCNSEFHLKLNIKMHLRVLCSVTSSWGLMDWIPPLLYICIGVRVLKNTQFNVCTWQEAEMQAITGISTFLPEICQPRHVWLRQNHSQPATEPNIWRCWSTLKALWTSVPAVQHADRESPILSGRAGLTVQDVCHTAAWRHLETRRATRRSTVAAVDTKSVQLLHRHPAYPYAELPRLRQFSETSETFQASCLPKQARKKNLSKTSEKHRFLDSLRWGRYEHQWRRGGAFSPASAGPPRHPALLTGLPSLPCRTAPSDGPTAHSSAPQTSFLSKIRKKKQMLAAMLPVSSARDCRESLRRWIKHNTRFQKRKQIKTFLNMQSW